MAFLLLAGSMLVLSRSLQRERWEPSDVVAGAITATLAAVLAFSIIGATSVEAGRPLRDWRTWDIVGVGQHSPPLRLDAELPTAPGPRRRRAGHARPVGAPLVLARQRPRQLRRPSWWSDAPGSAPVKPDAECREATSTRSRPAASSQPGRVVTESFEVEITYTNDLFIGGWPSSVQMPRPVDLRVGDARNLDVDPPLGPKLSYAVTALVPQLEPADLIERGSDYPAAVLEHYSNLPFPTLARAGRPVARGALERHDEHLAPDGAGSGSACTA